MERTDSAWVAGRKATRHHNQIKSSRRLSRRRICTILEPDYAAARRKFAKRDQNSVYNIMRRQIFLFLTQLRDIVAWKANRKFPRPPKTTNFRERLPLYIKKIPFPDQEIASGRPQNGGNRSNRPTTSSKLTHLDQLSRKIPRLVEKSGLRPRTSL